MTNRVGLLDDRACAKACARLTIGKSVKRGIVQALQDPRPDEVNDFGAVRLYLSELAAMCDRAAKSPDVRVLSTTLNVIAMQSSALESIR
jgi:hypothetical protein